MINLGALIKPASEASTHLKMCIYGDPGTGKTTFAAHAPKPIIIDTEKGTTTLVKDPVLRNIPVIQRSSLQEMVEIVEYLRSPAGDSYETVIVDTVSELSNLFLDTIVKNTKNNAYAIPENGYKERNQQGRRMFSDLMSLNKNVILLSHAGTVQENNITVKAPALSAAMLSTLYGLMDVVGYMYLSVDPTPTKENPSATTITRYIQTIPTATLKAKNRIDTPGVIENPSVDMFFKSKQKVSAPDTLFKD
jgi:phage nucleotide-binding protein